MNNCRLYHFMIRKYETNATTMVGDVDFDFRFCFDVARLSSFSIMSPSNVTVSAVRTAKLLCSVHALRSYFLTQKKKKVVSPVFYTSLDDGKDHDSIHVPVLACRWMQTYLNHMLYAPYVHERPISVYGTEKCVSFLPYDRLRRKWKKSKNETRKFTRTSFAHICESCG